MHYFYVLFSLKDGKLYKGYSTDPAKRLIRHNAGATPSTKHRRPLILIYLEAFPEKSAAIERERWAKSPSGGPELVQILIEKKIISSDRTLLTPSAG